MIDAPERIWIESRAEETAEGYGSWDCRNAYEYDLEYIRADIPAAVTVDREAIARAIVKSDREWNADESITQDWADFLADAILSAITPDQPATEQPDAVQEAARVKVDDVVKLAHSMTGDWDHIEVHSFEAALRALEGGES